MLDKHIKMDQFLNRFLVKTKIQALDPYGLMLIRINTMVQPCSNCNHENCFSGGSNGKTCSIWSCYLHFSSGIFYFFHTLFNILQIINNSTWSISSHWFLFIASITLGFVVLSDKTKSKTTCFSYFVWLHRPFQYRMH